ncbi:hypothetical protein ASF60_08715 [Methylobacterium sp. Leaf113]|nr:MULTISPECIES: hypothetical protein [unclassified Methylobacterium]KQP73533.1 hypothetical protein ASF60_08715 [Methylobacterium sp. Leaf113]KQP96527.1 hypothetical protein ASF57_01935 [Methylobacterium sp. Leaf117]
MRIAVMSTVTLVAMITAGSAAAEDFTGFYAGVNAGYAFGAGERDARGARPDAASEVAGATAGNGMPPSAMEASRALQARNRTPQPGSANPLPR